MGCDVTRISDLNRRQVFDATGKPLGRLHELETKAGRIEQLVYGQAGFFERMTGRTVLTKQPWSEVAKIDGDGIHLSTVPAATRKKAE